MLKWDAARRNPTLQGLGGCVGAEASGRNDGGMTALFEECKRGGEGLWQELSPHVLLSLLHLLSMLLDVRWGEYGRQRNFRKAKFA